MIQIELVNNHVGSRLREVRLAKKMTLEQFYGPVTNHISNCSAIEKGKRGIGKRLSNDIIGFHRINTEWLLKGEGDMFIFETGLTSAQASEHSPGVPFLNVDLSELSYEGFDQLREHPEYYVNYRPFNDCDAYLPIYGDSMYPKYASGEIIAVREITNFDIIQWGEAYLVVADERANNMVTVKLVFEHPDDDRFILRSSNPNFKGDTVIEKRFISKLFLIKGKVTRNQL